MSKEKYLSIFSPKGGYIVYISLHKFLAEEVFGALEYSPVTHFSCFLFHNSFCLESYKYSRKPFYLPLGFVTGYLRDLRADI